MHHLTALVTHNLKKLCGQEFLDYQRILDHSFEAASPPFGEAWFGRAYFELARDKEWFANSLVANSALEGYGSRQIWKFSNKLNNDEYLEEVRKHALDESRHSTMFVSMLKLTFPGISIDEKTAQRIEDQQPRFSRSNLPREDRLPVEMRLTEDAALNELVQVHITEIRALVLQYLLRSVIEVYVPAQNRKRISMFTTSLIRDEAAHIQYTAKIFDAAAQAGKLDFLTNLFEARVRDFNDLTLLEFERDRQIAI